MASKQFYEGVDKMLAELRAVADPEPAIIEGLKAGSGPLANATRTEASRLPTAAYRGQRKTGKQAGITETQKAALQPKIGVTPVGNRDGVYNIKVGFGGGYTTYQTKRWPRGVPIRLIAASVNKGTRWLKAYPLIKRSVNAAQSSAQKALQDAFDKALEQAIKKK